MKPGKSIEVENIDHLGLIAGIIDEIGKVSCHKSRLVLQAVKNIMGVLLGLNRF